MNKINLVQNLAKEVDMIGISTSLKDYRLSLFINNTFSLCLKKLNDFDADYIVKKDNSRFSVYYYNDIDNLTKYFLLSNKCNLSVLIPSYKQADFFMIMLSSVLKNNTDEIINKIKKIKNIQTAFPVDKSQIKIFNSLINGLTYHLEINTM